MWDYSRGCDGTRTEGKRHQPAPTSGSRDIFRVPTALANGKGREDVETAPATTLRSSADRMIFFRLMLMTSRLGAGWTGVVQRSCRNTGVSRMPSRIHQPDRTKHDREQKGNAQHQTANGRPTRR